MSYLYNILHQKSDFGEHWGRPAGVKDVYHSDIDENICWDHS